MKSNCFGWNCEYQKKDQAIPQITQHIKKKINLGPSLDDRGYLSTFSESQGLEARTEKKVPGQTFLYKSLAKRFKIYSLFGTTQTFGSNHLSVIYKLWTIHLISILHM